MLLIRTKQGEMEGRMRIGKKKKLFRSRHRAPSRIRKARLLLFDI